MFLYVQTGMNVLLKAMIVMTMQRAPTVLAVTYVLATEHSWEMAEIAQVSQSNF